ncbi:MAG: acetyl CoA synthetase, partial [Methanobacteriota archaeon]
MATENLRYLFNPESVAVIGASNKKGKLGYEIVENLVEYGYKGKIYPINPRHAEILGLTVYPSVLDVPDSVDLAIIAVPAKIVSSVLEQCGRKGVKAVVVIASGFGEIGEKEMEKKLVEVASKHGMCLLGPNVFGVISPPNKLNASFGPRNVLPGNIAFITQSGALGIAIIDWAIQQKIGLSAVVPLGNKAHVDDADLLEYFLEDKNTKSIVIYLEGVRDGRRFLAVATRVVRKKPVIVIKAGRSPRGASAAASHTGSLAGSDQVFSAAADQAGLIRAFTLEEAFDYAKVVSTTPKPWGRNVV